MWTCPRCNHKFINKNQSHSCGQFTVGEFLKGKSEQAVFLFRSFLEAYKSIGPYELHPVKTRVALLAQMRFASINKLGLDYLDGHFVLTKSLPNNTIIYKIDNLNDRFFVHHFRIYTRSQIDGRFRKYMRLAYEVGERRHIRTPRKGGITSASAQKLLHVNARRRK